MRVYVLEAATDMEGSSRASAHAALRGAKAAAIGLRCLAHQVGSGHEHVPYRWKKAGGAMWQAYPAGVAAAHASPCSLDITAFTVQP